MERESPALLAWEHASVVKAVSASFPPLQGSPEGSMDIHNDCSAATATQQGVHIQKIERRVRDGMGVTEETVCKLKANYIWVFYLENFTCN